MKVDVYLASDALEKLAKEETELYSWDFAVRETGETPPPDSYCCLSAAEVSLPPRDYAAGQAVLALQKRKSAVYAMAAIEAKEIDVRIQNLLALEAPGKAPV